MAKSGGAAQQAAIAIHEKQAAAKKSAGKKSAAKKAPAKKAAAKKTPAKKTAATKASATKASATKASATKTAAKKSVAKKSAAKKTVAKGKASATKAGQDPRGGLNDEGRRQINSKTGSHLKPGVKGTPKNAEEKKRKGSFLTRHFTTPPGPVVKDGKPTRQALQAAAWGEPVPQSEADEQKLAEKGRALLAEAKEEK